MNNIVLSDKLEITESGNYQVFEISEETYFEKIKNARKSGNLRNSLKNEAMIQFINDKLENSLDVNRSYNVESSDSIFVKIGSRYLCANFFNRTQENRGGTTWEEDVTQIEREAKLKYGNDWRVAMANELGVTRSNIGKLLNVSRNNSITYAKLKPILNLLDMHFYKKT